MNQSKVALSIIVAAVLIGAVLMRIHHGPGASRPKAVTTPTGAFVPLAPPRAKGADDTPASARNEPPPVPENVRRKVDAILRRHKGLSKAEMLRTEEMQQIIDSFYEKVNRCSLEMQRKMDQASEDIHAAKGVGPDEGAIVFNVGEPDSPELRAWLEAAVSDDPARAQDWMLGRLRGAAFEFSVKPALDRTGDGVGFKPPPGAPSHTGR